MLGAGTQISPYLISTPSDLDSIRNNRARNIYYELTNDIDMYSWGNWNPIAYYDNSNWVSGFEGNFDGKGFKIKNLTVTKSTGIYLGLFGQAFYGTIQNVGLENVTINGSQCRFAGALIGYGYQLTVKNCYVNGGSITSQDESGGLLGKMLESNISDSYANIPITLNTDYYGGGFVGTADSITTFRNCYASGKVTYTQPSNWSGISGFVGYVRNNEDVFFYDCYWDKESSGQQTTAKISSPPSTMVTGLTGKTTSEMKTQSTFTVWDFTNTWSIQNDYPTLRVFGVPIVAKKETILVNTYVPGLDSNLLIHKKSSKEVQSHLNQFIATSKRDTATFRSVEGYLSQIETAIVSNARTVRSGTRYLTSSLNPIESFVERESKTVKSLISHIKPISSDISVIIPVSTFTPNAYVSVLESINKAYRIENMSEVSYILNPSHVEVRK